MISIAPSDGVILVKRVDEDVETNGELLIASDKIDVWEVVAAGDCENCEVGDVVYLDGVPRQKPVVDGDTEYYFALEVNILGTREK